MRINTFGLAFVAAALLGSTVHAAVIPIQNHDFASPLIGTTPAFIRHTTAGDLASNTLPGWTVTGTDVDQLGTRYQDSTDTGTGSLDLNGSALGGVRQTIFVPSANNFRLDFAMSGNPDGGLSNRGVKTLRLTLSLGVVDVYTQLFSYDTLLAGNTRTDMMWAERTAIIPNLVAGNYTLAFTPVSPNQFGPTIDNVRAQVPDGGLTVALLGLGMGAVGLIRRKLA